MGCAERSPFISYTQGQSMKKIDIRGVLISDVTMDEAVSFISEKLTSRTPVSVFTPNAEIAERAVKDLRLLQVINGCDLAVPDGVGIVKASRILGRPLREKVAGVELGIKVAELAAKTGASLFLYGGKEGVAEDAAKNLQSKFPALNIAGYADGYRDDESAVLEEIRNSGADILFVCLGSPKQEMWIHHHKAELPDVRVFMGLGGSLDIYSGKARRAPRIFIRLELEWLYRLLREPKRIVRMRALPRFYFGTWLYRFKK